MPAETIRSHWRQLSLVGVVLNGVAMKFRLLFTLALGLAFSTAHAQNSPGSAPDGPDQAAQADQGDYAAPPSQPFAAGGGPDQNQAQDQDQVQDQAQTQSQRIGGGGPGIGAGPGLMGAVTGVAAGHYTIKTDEGDLYTVYFSANTRILKQMVQRGGHGENGRAGSSGPLQLQPSDIHVGDSIAALGEVDRAAHSVGATLVLELDPARAQQMRDLRDGYGKTWLMGRVTEIDASTVTLLGRIDHAPHTFVAGPSTTFRKRREPITLADLRVGDRLRVEGAVKDGSFQATSVLVLGRPPEGMPMLPRQAPPAPASQPE